MGGGSGRRRAVAGLLAGAVAVFGQGTGGAARNRKKHKICKHCPQRACWACTSDNFQTANKCILLETPNADVTLTVAAALCDEFCSGANEQPFGVNDDIAGLANFCGADNKCKVKECPVKL